jgi:hypothetical protein
MNQIGFAGITEQAARMLARDPPHGKGAAARGWAGANQGLGVAKPGFQVDTGAGMSHKRINGPDLGLGERLDNKLLVRLRFSTHRHGLADSGSQHLDSDQGCTAGAAG